MTRKTFRRLREKKAVLKRLQDGNPLRERYILLERLGIINHKLEVFYNYNNLMAESIRRPLGRSVFAGKGNEL